MSEAPTALFPNPLLPLHQQAQAEFQSYEMLEIVSTFGQPEAEYAAIRKSAGLMDQPQRGLLELTGKDRLKFLNNLITNVTCDKSGKSHLPVGGAIYSFLLNNKGRIAFDLNVLEIAERTLIETDVRMIEPLRATLDKYLFVEDVALTSQVGKLHQIALHGPGALAALQSAGVAINELQPVGGTPAVAATMIFDVPIVVWRDDPAAVPGYHIIVPIEGVERVWTNLIALLGQPAALGRRTLRPVGWAAFNTARIEGGRGLFGIDYDDSILPAETGQFERAVSLSKGCYLGQEIVARMHSRQQVSRQLVGIRMENEALPLAGSKIFDDQSNEIGGVTSSTISPVLSNVAICLGHLKKPFFTIGAVVTIPAEGAMHRGQVVATPFIQTT